MLAINF